MYLLQLALLIFPEKAFPPNFPGGEVPPCHPISRLWIGFKCSVAICFTINISNVRSYLTNPWTNFAFLIVSFQLFCMLVYFIILYCINVCILYMYIVYVYSICQRRNDINGWFKNAQSILTPIGRIFSIHYIVYTQSLKLKNEKF